MDWTLEFHGSEVQWTEVTDGQACLRFSAAAVRRRVDGALEEGHVKGLELRFSGVTAAAGDPALCLGALSDSLLTINGVRHRHIPVPFEALGDVRAEFNFKSGTTLALSAGAVHGLPPAAPHFQTSYAC